MIPSGDFSPEVDALLVSRSTSEIDGGVELSDGAVVKAASISARKARLVASDGQEIIGLSVLQGRLPAGDAPCARDRVDPRSPRNDPTATEGEAYLEGAIRSGAWASSKSVDSKNHARPKP